MSMTKNMKRLVRRVVQGDPDAWQEYVTRISNHLFSLVWISAPHDADLRARLFLYVMECLRERSESGEPFHRLQRYLRSLDVYGARARHATWLGCVALNLVSDCQLQLPGRQTLDVIGKAAV